HQRARTCGQKLESQSWVEEVFPVFTNIVLFKVGDHLSSADIVQKLAAKNIMCAPVNDKLVRWVFHLDIDDQMLDYVADVSENLF
ncbi:MAG: threonine aldolase, partial [Saprospiraceae bacterium]